MKKAKAITLLSIVSAIVAFFLVFSFVPFSFGVKEFNSSLGAIELDYAGVSITDHEALSGHIQFMQRYQELKKLRKKYVEFKNLGKEEEIAKDKALERRFQTTIIKEPNFEETKNILMKLKPIYENYHQVIVPETIIDNIIKLADKYIFNRKNPDKTIVILCLFL